MGDEDEWREWRARGLPHGDPEADGRDRRSGWHDPPQERGGHQQSGGFDRGRGKWEPKAEDLWYAKLEEEGNHNWNGKSKEFFVDHAYYKNGQSGAGMRASERLQVPSFNAEDSEDLGGSARSYLRQIEAWKRMTMLPPNKQALVLYQNLSGKAWIAAEELSLARLGEDTGVGYLVSWVTARFLDLEITRIGRALSDFFRKLRRRPNQTVREYNSEYDRLYGRLREVGCCLPEECAAWVYIDRLQLDEPQELNLLASVGNRYDLLRLQQAAVLHDRGHRKPWENSNPKGRRTNYANMTSDLTGIDEDVLEEPDEEDGIPEEVAQAWVTFRSAKDKYKSQQRARGYQGESDRPRDPEHDNTLKQMKMKSFCSGCGRRGHWHKDAECPNNQGGNGKNHANPDNRDKGRTGKDTRDVAMTTVLPASVYALKHVPHVLLGVADTACSRTVAGTQWLQTYADAIAEHGDRPTLHKENEAYRFGTGRVHVSSFYVVVCFELGDKIVKVRTSIITGDIPLLLSKGVLGKLGMVFDVENMRADFNKVGLRQYELMSTASGHPAIPIVPARASAGTTPALEIEDLELAPKESYMSVFAAAYQGPLKPDLTGIFQPKKLEPAVRNLLSEDRLAQDPYWTWWKQTAVDRDFWLETPDAWIRVHIVPRRALFNPSNWRTTASMQQDMLIAMIGKTRMTESVCCSTGRWNEQVLDHWCPGQFEQPHVPATLGWKICLLQDCP